MCAHLYREDIDHAPPSKDANPDEPLHAAPIMPVLARPGVVLRPPSLREDLVVCVRRGGRKPEAEDDMECVEERGERGPRRGELGVRRREERWKAGEQFFG